MKTQRTHATKRATCRSCGRHKRLAAAIATALAMPVGILSSARAQEAAQPGGALEEIVITGSRIVRRDYEANSPIQTIDAASFEAQSAIGMEDTLNELPQFVPAATGYTQVQDGELIFTGSTVTSGASMVSLRGLGPNRNLVLLDGYRAMPVNATMAVDLNSIPAAAIERVEVITGGASSVYGADAVAGVVNFITRKDFEGVDLDIQYGAMQNGEAGETRASALFGVNTEGGRGNIMLGLEVASRRAVEWKDVDFYREGDGRPDSAGHDLDRDGPVLADRQAEPADGRPPSTGSSRRRRDVVLRNAARRYHRTGLPER